MYFDISTHIDIPIAMMEKGAGTKVFDDYSGGLVVVPLVPEAETTQIPLTTTLPGGH